MKSKRNKICGEWMILFCAIALSGCDIINPDEAIPTRIELEAFDFQILPGQGSARHKITEVWVYANSNFHGVFNMPVDIVYLGEGATQFTFRPGIRNNGILDDPIVYPLYNGYTIELNALPGVIYQVHPVTGYKPEVFFTLLADFEIGNEFVDNRDTVAASNVIQSVTDVFEGQFSGEIILSESAHFIEVGHALPIGNLPADGRPVYLEFRYKNEVVIDVGLLGINLEGQSFSNFFYFVKPSAEWNMLYIELTDFISASALPAYKILFRSGYPHNATQPEYKIFLDNIKVVHL